jgi:hypothetical protein
MRVKIRKSDRFYFVEYRDEFTQRWEEITFRILKTIKSAIHVKRSFIQTMRQLERVI